jgi:predicted nuclease of predicted toxin-antitoxin system
LTEATAIPLVLDQGLPRDAAVLLRDLGHECIHVGEIGMWNAAADAILAFASGKQATVVTLDADFHAILAVSGASRPSVIRFRVQGLRARETVVLIRRVLAVFANDLLRGALITVKARKTTATGCRSADLNELGRRKGIYRS